MPLKRVLTCIATLMVLFWLLHLGAPRAPAVWQAAVKRGMSSVIGGKE